MAEIYDEICKINPSMSPHQKDTHALNVFLSRLLFCYFADSTEIFPKNIFIEILSSYAEEDGSDLREFFEELFERLNTNVTRSKCPKYLKDFPYVNGGLFKERFKIPKFSTRLHKMIIDCGKLDWSSINPDIFGSMIQSVVDPTQRNHLGMHYTSVPNIMKVIRPLFLDELYEELASSKSNKKQLNVLYDRLGKIRIFDPACGSGNFLIIAYKELRLFETQLLQELEKVGKHPTFLSQIQLSQFYGIEIDEFACEVAKLSLWIAEHQMNKISEQTFNKWAASLPLKEGGHIVCGNAARLDWEKVCPQIPYLETYLLGNPPYQGARKQSKEQKIDMESSLPLDCEKNNLDYVCCWIFKAAKYIKNGKSFASFVVTNSITQGSQVSLFWPHLFALGIEIGFAHTSFKWDNNAKNKAVVSCVIIGIRKICSKQKFITENSEKRKVSYINGYLKNTNFKFVNKRRTSISNLPKIVCGSMPNDGGHLFLNAEEKKKIIQTHPSSFKFIRKLIGAEEFIKNIEKFCLWIDDENLKEALSIPPIKVRLAKVKAIRRNSKRSITRKLAEKAHQFGEIRHLNKDYIFIPLVTSENREYIPIGLGNKRIIANNRLHVIYSQDISLFGLLSSKMHFVWVKGIGGGMKTDLSYSADICYNNFPIPKFTNEQKEIITKYSKKIISERENHEYLGKTIAELYDPKKMPTSLKKAHQDLDAAIERCYRSKPFESDEERLEHLFKLYEEMIQAEKKRK